MSEEGRAPGRVRRTASRVAASARNLERSPKVLTAAKLAREVRERRHFGVKGVPSDVTAYSVSRA